ncbi:MAG: glutamyl-tRNA reductase, partial [Dehalococcoidia bacterium]
MITVAGISHHTAPLEIRERFAISGETLTAALADLRGRFGAAVILSTCNRTELYLSRPASAIDAESQRDALLSLARRPDVHPDFIYSHGGREAARHLLRVASGLDSMVVGEDQVLGQVRTAFTMAADAGATDRLLSRLFHLAIATGRRVRSQTAIGRYARSVSIAAVETARLRLGGLESATVLVLGAGEAGKLTAQSLAQAGTRRLLLFNRTYERAARVAEAVHGEALPQDGLPAALAEADVIIAASAASEYQLTRAALASARGEVSGRPLLVIDIAVPRDVEPAVEALPGVTLLDIDGLRADGADADRPDDVAAAEAIIEVEVGRLATWWDTLRVVPTISALRERAEAIRQAELARSLGRLRDLTPDERARVEALTAAIVNKMLHH